MQLRLVTLCMSFMYNRNNNRLKIEPWGTPYDTGVGLDLEASIHTNWLLVIK